jgi:hypothetical protein
MCSKLVVYTLGAQTIQWYTRVSRYDGRNTTVAIRYTIRYGLYRGYKRYNSLKKKYIYHALLRNLLTYLNTQCK